MKYLVESMIEDMKAMRPDVYPVDSDSLGDTYVTYCKCIDAQAKEFETRIREIIGACPKININGNTKILNEEFPTYAAISSPVTMSISNLCPIVTNSYKTISEEDAMGVFSKGLAGEITKGTSCPYTDNLQNAINYMGNHTSNAKPTGDYINSCQVSLVKKVLNSISLVYEIAEMFKGFDKCETQEQYQSQANLFTSILTDITSVVGMYMKLHNRVYSIAKHVPTPIEEKYRLAKNKMDIIKSGLDKHIDIQNRWNKLHIEPNREIERKVQNLNEKYIEAKDEAYLSEEAWNDEMNNDLTRYSESLRSAIENSRNFYNKYHYKEFLKPNCKHIDKMDEYLRGALAKEYSLRIPMYSSSNKSAKIRSLIRDDFVPGLSNAIASNDFCVICPTLDGEEDDIYIYMTLREPVVPLNEQIPQNEASEITPANYDIVQSGKMYTVYFIDPNNNDKRIQVCNSGTYSEARSDINDDIQERKERAAKEMKPMNNSAYCLLNMDEATLSSKEREAMPSNQFGIPSLKAYPLNDKTHIEKAVQFFNFAKYENKQELAKNIEKAVIANRLVGTVTVSKNHPGRKYFHDWMLATSNATMNDNKDGTYTIIVDGKNVATGSFNNASRTEESSGSENITESAIQLLI